ncbi:DUF1127 domain-containing protein [Aureimonas leprariae]|nr:DUF1127 domain-containing protein [Aureimonas leprariae]
MFRDLYLKYERHRKRQRDMARLNELNDDLLLDIGLTRSQIENAVHTGRIFP